MTNNYIPGAGQTGAELMIIGEAPTSNDSDQGRNFTGSEGRQLDKVLEEASISRGECWLTTVSKFYVPPNTGVKKIPFSVRAKQVGVDVRQQIEELQVEINSVQPNCIIALGSSVLWALTGKTNISNWRGSILRGLGKKVVATYNPAHLLFGKGGEIKGYWNKQIIIFDLIRAYKQSKFSEVRSPKKILTVCKNSAQLADFIQRYKKYERPAVDIESLNCVPSCIGFAFTPSEGISIPLWNQSGISNIPDSDLVNIWILVSKLLNDHDIVGQNFKYDEDKLIHIGFSIRKLASDTMLKAFAINPELPKSLAFNTSIYTEEPYYKDEGANFDPRKQSIDDLYRYNARDACVTKEIDLAMDSDLDELGMRKYYENFIMKLHPLYLDIESVGFRVDPLAREKLIEKYVKWDERLRYELFALIGDEINTSSPKQVELLLYENFKLPRRQGAKTNEEDLTRLINHSKVKDEYKHIISLILEDRRVKKTISTYLMALPDYDNRMKTTYFLCLETGRTSSGQQEPPIRPQVEVTNERNAKTKKNLGIAFQTITKHGDIGQDVRSMYIPDEGEIFIGIDSSQAEARVIAFLADDEQMLRMYDDHDVHALTASWFFGGTESDYSKKALGYESPTRFVGKTLRHAGHLGAGKRRAATSVNTDARKYNIDITITEAIADRALKVFHAKSPAIQGVFHAGVVAALEKGRMLTAALPYGIDAPHGGVRIFYERWGDELFRKAYSYIPQRSISDNTKNALLRIKKRVPGIKIILEAHDGALLSVKKTRVNEIVTIAQEEMERELDFSACSLPRKKLSIPCEVEVGMNYMEFDNYDPARFL